MKILLIGAHTDDIELGAGGTLAKHVEAGDYVKMITLSSLYNDGTLDLTHEFTKSAVLLGASDMEIQHIPVRRFYKERERILDYLYYLAKEKFDIVYTHSSTDTHQDHEVTHQEVFRAFKHTTVYGWEMPWNQRSMNKKHFVRLKSEHVKAKIDAIKCYESQAHRLPMSAEFITSLAVVNGVICVSGYAESFEVINSIA